MASRPMIRFNQKITTTKNVNNKWDIEKEIINDNVNEINIIKVQRQYNLTE